jgi:hypothetical protein
MQMLEEKNLLQRKQGGQKGDVLIKKSGQKIVSV